MIKWDDAFALIALPQAFLTGFFAAVYDIDKFHKKKDKTGREAEEK